MLETNFKFGEVHKLASQINDHSDRVQVRHIFSNSNGGVTLLGFTAGQKLDEHLAPAELMVNVLEGEIIFTMNGVAHTIGRGEFLLVGEGVPHSVVANTDSKVLLIKVKA